MDETKVRSNENNLDLTNEEMCAWKDNNERIQIHGVSRSKPIKGNHSVTASRLWKYFQIWLITSAVASRFTSNDENGSIGQHRGSRIPSPSLSDKLIYLKPIWFNPPEDWESCSFLPNRWCHWLQENHRAYIGGVRISIPKTIRQYWFDGQPCQAGQYFRSRIHRFGRAFHATHERNHRPR